MSDERPWGSRVALLEREAVLPLDRVSPKMARQLLRDVLEATEHTEWLDSAELAVSEIVTNAVLHAHTEVKIWTAVFDNLVCVEVSDGNPAPPSMRNYNVEASTGRGLGLVAILSMMCGIRSEGAQGKVIWFCIGDPDGAPSAGEWAIDAFAPASDPERRTVVLRSMPPTLWLAARQHHDALMRELALHAAEHDGVAVDFAQVDRARNCVSDAVARIVAEAHAAGTARPPLPAGHPSPLPWVPEDFDLKLEVDTADAGAYLAVPDALDLAERLAVGGELLVLPGLPEVIAVGDWAFEQVVAQLAGSPGAPWPGTAHDRFETETHGRALPDEALWDVSAVRDSDRGVVAADDANRILAISRPLAEALGWAPHDLVGRRVVTLIPLKLREAHVAGFSRHLSTGEAHVLGVPLELPVLRADGREIVCDFLIERAAAGPGRAVYLAWIEPKQK